MDTKKDINNIKTAKNTTRTKIFLICAEKSGNNILKSVLTDLKSTIGEQTFSNIDFQGIVYENVSQDFGVKQLFSPEELAVFGIGDIIFRLPQILDRITFTANKILEWQPNLVLSVDAYDFCFRVAKKVRSHQSSKIKFWHIVAPNVWAHGDSRAKKVAKNFNRLFYLLPFEKKYFKPLELQGENGFTSTFIGYPATFQQCNTEITKDDKLIGITIGSRKGEIKRHLGLIIETIMLLRLLDPAYHFVILATKDTSNQIAQAVKEIKQTTIIDDDNEKQQTIQKCSLVIAKSGTNNIEIGALGTAMITYYKTSKITYFLAKMLVKIKLINLYNITLGKMVIPEFIQQNATASNLSTCANQFMIKPEAREKQLQQIAIAISEMQIKNTYPTKIVANEISKIL